MAEDCLLAQPIERQLYWRNPTLKLGETAAIYDPIETLRFSARVASTG